MEQINFSCYLCGSSHYTVRPGRVRDNEHLVPLECSACGLVSLSSFDHICVQFYESSQMHEDSPVTAELADEQAIADDVRRLHAFAHELQNKSVLDFGCGSGRFLSLSKNFAKNAMGVELDKRWTAIHQQLGISVKNKLAELTERYDVVTMFHVLEHISDPIALLQSIREKYLENGGKLIVEVPNAQDALLTLYENRHFSEFTYWSCHLFLYSPSTLAALFEQAGFEPIEIIQCQRYPLANHLYWLAKGKPGGHKLWKDLDSVALNNSYADALARLGKCDTIIGVFTAK